MNPDPTKLINRKAIGCLHFRIGVKKSVLMVSLLAALSLPALTLAVEAAPRITDREIIERLTKLEEGQNGLRVEIRQLREDMNAQFSRIDAQFGRIDAQFGRMSNLILGILGAFAALVASTIGFAIWDRRTMIRPFESKIRGIEEEISQNRERLRSLLEAFRALSQSDEKVAEVLRRFNLL